jgi:hypothetical protein
VKKLVLLTLALSHMAWGQGSLNLNIPQSSQTHAQDKIRAGNVDCQNAIGSGTNFEFGVVGIIEQGDEMFKPQIQTYEDQEFRDVGVYARINIPIGGPKERINCNTLYQLELTKKRLEVEKLQREVQQLRELQFTDDVEEK